MKISTKKSQIPTPSLTFFLFLPLAQKGHFWCVCFCREKNGKGGRYTPIGHDSFAMWLLFYKLEMLQTKVGCLGVPGYCVHSMSNLFSSKGSFLVFSLALREDTQNTLWKKYVAQRFRDQFCARICSKTVRDIDMKPKGDCEGLLGGCYRLLEELTPPFHVFVSLKKENGNADERCPLVTLNWEGGL